MPDGCSEARDTRMEAATAAAPVPRPAPLDVILTAKVALEDTDTEDVEPPRQLGVPTLLESMERLWDYPADRESRDAAQSNRGSHLHHPARQPLCRDCASWQVGRG